MRLLVFPVLKRVLGASEETIGLRQGFAFLGVEYRASCKRSQRDERTTVTQPGIAAAPDDLKQLGGELDFADAASPELDVACFKIARRAARNL